MPLTKTTGLPYMERRFKGISNSFECYSSTRQSLISVIITAPKLHCFGHRKRDMSTLCDYCWSMAQIPKRRARMEGRCRKWRRGEHNKRLLNYYLNTRPSL